MATRQVKKKKNKVGKLIEGNFALSQSPLAVQLTVHINNMLITYPKQRHLILDEFKRCLDNDENLSMNFRVQQIISSYGKNVVRQWFKDIYGWNFTKEKAV